MQVCCICGLKGVWAYIKVPGTGKEVCVPCVQGLFDLYKQYIGNVIHKAPKTSPLIHEHRKIQDPDSPSGSMI